MDIGQRIRLRREELGMTQEELAKKLGYAGRSSVNKVETSREVSMKKIELYANALETTVPYLMGWEEQAEKTDMEIIADIVSDKTMYEIVFEMSKLENNEKEKVLEYIDFLKSKKGAD